MRRFLIAVLLLAACTQEPATPSKTAAPQPAPVTDDAERSSLLELAHGATVVDRTGEILLELSALRAIDGEPGSFWMNPPKDLPQSMTVALAARSRVDRVGFRTVSNGGFTAGHVTFESSLDGQSFTPVTTVRSADSSDPQWFDVKPFEASFLRVTMVDGYLPGHDVRIYSVLAHGNEMPPYVYGDINGCWSINGESARFDRRGSHISGILYTGKEPMRFDGGVLGNVARLSWIRGNDYGMSILAVSPDGQHINGLNWHEEAVPLFFDTSWFGERRPCTAPIPAFDVPIALLHRTGRFPLYDDSQVTRLVAREPAAVLVAHEFRRLSPEDNRTFAEHAMNDLREKYNLAGIKFVVQGSDAPRQQPVTDVMRALYSTIDVEIRR